MRHRKNWPALVAGLLVLSSAWHRAPALDAALDISQYAHKGWKIRAGFPPAVIESIAQTSDGYLWLGTQSGLIRFDGDHHQVWNAPGRSLRSIRALLGARDGSLWIGMPNGLARLHAQRLTDYADLAGFDVFSLLEDHEGTIWANGQTPIEDKLCAIRNESATCKVMPTRFGALQEDSSGGIWGAGVDGLWKVSPEPVRGWVNAGADPPLVTSVLEVGPGKLLVGTYSGIREFTAGQFAPGPTNLAGSDRLVTRLLRDKEGAVWAGMGHGLIHLHQGRADSFARVDGLTGEQVGSLYEDREGTIWVGTTDGLDQFRAYAIPTLSTKQGVRGVPLGVLSARDSSVWVATGQALTRVLRGQVTSYRSGAALHQAISDEYGANDSLEREIVDPGLGDDHGFAALTEDSEGRIWTASRHQVSVFAGGRYHPVIPLRDYVLAMAATRDGSIWVSSRTEGLLHILGNRIKERLAWSQFGSRGHATSLLPESRGNGLWLGFHGGGIAYLSEGGVHGFYDARNGLGNGQVKTLYLDENGTLWAATEAGLSGLRNGRFRTLTPDGGLPCARVHWVMQDDSKAFWLGTACGLVRIDEQELSRWLSGASQATKLTLFDSADGVRSQEEISDGSPLVTKASDGRLWFQALDGVSIVDPLHLHANPVPPPVHIESLVVDRKSYSPFQTIDVPPLPRELKVEYAGLSLVAPEKVQFRYKLEGHDRDWQDVGNRRQAFYTDLPPGKYRFRVIASNNSGVWNPRGASLDFSIAPAYWQTLWFRAACVAAFAALLVLVYRFRLRAVARNFERTLDTRVAERTRIARELHDTLLQSFNGLLLRFATASRLFRSKPEEAIKMLDDTIDQARQAVREGRDAVQGLRSSTEEPNNLSEAIGRLAAELSTHTPSADGGGAVGSAPMDIRVQVKGEPRPLHPIVRDEIYRIAAEALRNALRHSGGTQIEVEIQYEARQIQLRIRDDGRGIDETVLERGREGHFGIRGMHERAKLAGGRLSVWSAPNSGTELELTIPGSRAYAAPRKRQGVDA